MVYGGPVPDETVQRSRRSHPEAGGVEKPAHEMRIEVGCCGVGHENLNRSLPRLTCVSASMQRRGWLGKSKSAGSGPQKTKENSSDDIGLRRCRLSQGIDANRRQRLE